MKSTDTIDKRIQLDIKVINDIVHEVRNKPNLKMLVFGLGYDSKLWFKELGKNVYFVEHDKKYVNLNNTIPQKNIIEYGYRNINVYDSLKRVQNTSYIESYKMPTELAKVGPFDIILIASASMTIGLLELSKIFFNILVVFLSQPIPGPIPMAE